MSDANANAALVPDAVTITPAGEARFILGHVADVTGTERHVSGAALAGRARAMGFDVPAGVSLDEFADVAAEVLDR